MVRQRQAWTRGAERRGLGLARWAVVLTAAQMGMGCGPVSDAVTGWIELAHGHPLGPLAMVAAVVASGFVAAPLTVTMIPAMVVFGPAFGSLWTLIGATISGAVFFQLGSHGASFARRLGAPRLLHPRLTQLLERNGIVAVALARFLPLAPYPVVNAALGATPVKFRDFLVGNLLGLLPWVCLYAVAGGRLRELLIAPSPVRVVILALTALAVAAVLAAATYAASHVLATDAIGDRPSGSE